MNCPICGSNDYEYISFSEDYFGIVERHGSCERCGYIVEQAYSPIMEAYRDIKRGIKTRDGYIEKNAKKHKRIRKNATHQKWMLIRFGRGMCRKVKTNERNSFQGKAD